MLSKDDVDKMVRDAESHADEDKKRREEVELRNQAEQLTYQAERTLKDLGDKVSAEDRAAVESQVATLREALKGSDVDAINAGMQALVETLSRVSTAAYQAADAGLSDGDGSSGDGAEGPADGEGEPAGARSGGDAGRRDGRRRVQGGLASVSPRIKTARRLTPAGRFRSRELVLQPATGPALPRRCQVWLGTSERSVAGRCARFRRRSISDGVSGGLARVGDDPRRRRATSPDDIALRRGCMKSSSGSGAWARTALASGPTAR